MTGRVILDTNIVIALWINDLLVYQRIAETNEVLVPAIVLGELYFGAKKSSKPSENILRVDNLAAQTTVIPCDLETARHYGRIKAELKSQGTPIPENDIWIAALAMQYDTALITRDDHFNAVKGLISERW